MSDPPINPTPMNESPSLPPSARRALKKLLVIPIDCRAALLPDANTSLNEIADFKLPVQQTTRPKSTMFLSNEEPTAISPATLQRLRYLPIPDSESIKDLVRTSHTACMNGARSVRYAHLSSEGHTSTLFPLWVIDFWKNIIELQEVVAKWTTCKDWVLHQQRQRKSPEVRTLADEALAVMSLLPYGVPKPNGLSDKSPIHETSRYLATNWLSEVHINDLLEILRRETPQGTFKIEGTPLTSKVLEAFNNRERRPYATEQAFAWIRAIGDSLVQSRLAVVTAVYLGNLTQSKHWVPLVVSSGGAEILFGDSLGAPIPPKLRDAYVWWILQHNPSSTPVVKPLPITEQLDGHACGILTINSLRHFVNPGKYMLVGGLKASIASERLKAFNTISDHIIKRIDFTAVNEASNPITSVASARFEEESKHKKFTFVSPIPTLLSTQTSQRNTSSSPSPSRASSPAPSSLSTPTTTKRPRTSSCASTPFASPAAKRIKPIDRNAASSPPPPLRFDLAELTPTGPVVEGGNGAFGYGTQPDGSGESESRENEGAPTPQKGEQTDEVVLKQQRIPEFWKKATTEEKQAMNHREFEKLRERVESSEAEAAQAAHRAKQRLREKNREYQRQSRERARAKRDAGVKAKVVELRDEEDYVSEVAEKSRPQRQYNEDRRKGNKTCGRKRKHDATIAKCTNWFSPFIWRQIQIAVKRAGRPWSPTEIVREAKKVDPKVFAKLTTQVVGRWIDRKAKYEGVSKWSDAVLRQVAKGNAPRGENTRTGILELYPEVRSAINKQLTSLRESGVPLTILSIRAIMVGIIQEHAPEVFEEVRKDGTRFKCSEAYVHKYLHKMGWSERSATKAAQKLPDNYQDILKEAHLREAHVIRDYNIPAALRVNTDQTQITYQHGANKTWNISGVKQVATVGQEEKRAFTLVPSISASGVLLPMQAVFVGMTDASCPNPRAGAYDEAMDLGFTMVPSKTKTYWSTEETMKDLVNDIIAPYFEEQKKELGLPPSQHSIWKIDCWSVHKSVSFRRWIQLTHPNIIVIFVPGNCTGVWQPLDVGIQRLLKLSVRRSAHRDLVNEVSSQLATGADSIKLDTTLGTLRNRAVGWVVNAIRELNNTEIITKAFELCQVGNFNLSQSSLTSPETLAALRELPKTNPRLYEELLGDGRAFPAPMDEEEDEFTECIDDGSDVPVAAVASHIAAAVDVVRGYEVLEDGSIARSALVEDADADVNEIVAGEVEKNLDVEETGRGRRKKKATIPFGGLAQWERD